MITPDRILPAGWRELIEPGHRTTIGYDPATTEGESSNPSGLAITQEIGREYHVKVGATWKTKDPDIARAVLAEAVNLPHGLRPHALVIDASNEKYFATDLKRTHSRRTRVILYVATENIEFRGETLPLKTFCGNLCKNALEDGRLVLPDEPWVYKNFRAVTEDKGRFVFAQDEDGNHCDYVQAVWNCLYGFSSPGSGPVAASAVGTASAFWGRLMGSLTARPSLRQPSPRFT